MSSHASLRLVAAIVLAGTVAASLALATRVKLEAERDALANFSNASDQVSSRIADRLQTFGLVLRSGAGVFSASVEVSRQDWRAYVDQLQPQLNLPGVQGIGYSLLLQPSEVEAHVASVRAEGFVDYALTPPGARDLYSAIVYLEPFSGRNLRAFGFDMYSEPVRRAAMEQARDSGLPTLSGRVQLVQEDETGMQAGTLMYFPVYDSSLPTTTPAERQAALRGWTYSPYRMDDLIDGILGDWQTQWNNLFDLYIYDGATATAANLLYPSNSDRADPADMHGHLLHQHRMIDFGGRQWLLVFNGPESGVGIDYSAAWLTLAGGLTISGLLFGLLLSLARTRSRAEAIAASLTAETRHHQAEVQRLYKALDTLSSHVYMKKRDYSYVYANKPTLELFGLTPATLVGIRDEAIFPAATVRRLREVDDRVFAGENTHEEIVVESPAGRRVYLELKTPIYSDPDRKELWGLCGISTDITDRKQLEQVLQQKTSALQHAQRIAQMGSWTLDVQTKAVEWTPELFRMFGLPHTPPAPSLPEQVRIFTAESYTRLNAALAETISKGVPYEIDLEIIRQDGSHGWILARGEASRDASGAVSKVHGIAMDLSERIMAKQRIEHLGRLYAALITCNAAIIHCHTDAELFETICRVVVDSGKMQLAWVGLVDEDSGRIIPRYWAGEGSSYLDGIEISVKADDPHGRGATGTATRENHPVWVDDFRVDPRSSPWHARAATYGWVASAALPVNRSGAAIGALTFYSTRQGWFDDETRGLLEQMARDISFALDKLDAEAEAARYQNTLLESEQRFRSLVEQSIVGAFIIQHDRFVYVNPRLESILGYSTGDLAGRSPADIVATKDKSEVRKTLASLLSGRSNAAELFFTAKGKDGNTIDVGATISLASYQQQTAIIGQMHDLANRRVAEEQIKRYARNLEKVFLQTVGIATNLVEMRDPYTAGHEKHVAEIAMAIGREMQLPQDRIEGLRVGGYLHDVGKIMVPTEILAKPGSITEVEYALIKHHPKAGYDILKVVEFPWPVADIALQHHERMDGSGYPRGLKGDEILLEARIIAVADVIESMASHRPYRPALGIDTALAEIEQGKGKRYDPLVVDCCLRLFREKGYQLPA